ncbi:hypothetical protein GIB67_037471 [Kingdonia uniflora]|uniref:FAD-binding domain-containing protein n=1 Tax=Kingdonia uniflora TaxID=39325 RepID=A0A7J7LNC4_9MAGN|nr:hypothetical protein GIB67_037471 [Kingdonia uniflora]
MAILRVINKKINGHYYSSNTRTKGFFSNSRRNFSSNLGGDDEVVPVLIVGAGPVGLVLSILLTKLGVKCAVMEKSKTFSQHPQAHFINNRSMEIFRKLGSVANEIQRLQPPVDLWRKFIYCTSLSGSILGSVDHMQPQDFEQIVSPVSVAHFSQYKLIKLLLEHLQDLDFRLCISDPLENPDHGPIEEGKILMGYECTSIQSANDDTILSSSTKPSGFQFREVCKEIIFKLAGQELLDLDVIDIKPWMMHAEVAENFISCDNRVILVGDAAHRFPPAGGFGMNMASGCYNLAWKIASLVKGIAPSSILTLMKQNAGPIALFNTALSVQNFKAAMSVPSALVWTQLLLIQVCTHALLTFFWLAVHQVINSAVGSILPSQIQRALVDGIFAVGRTQSFRNILNEKKPAWAFEAC